MAIIRCPECGHQISDRAPVCPSCGVEIAGKITKCAQCGMVFFKDEHHCPNCNNANPSSKIVTNSTSSSTAAPPTPQQNPQIEANGNNGNGSKNGKSRKLWIVAFLIALFVCCGVYYLYYSAKNEKMEEAYRIAMNSDDPLILQNFMNNYRDASQEMKDSIRIRLDMIKKGDEEWNNAIASGSKTALEEYLNKHPDTPKKGEIIHRIDSIDWITAKAANTIEGYMLYMEEHGSGEHIDECKTAYNDLKAKDVQPEEKESIALLFRHFFQSINSKNEDGLTSTVSSFLSSFLGKTDATKADVVTFMHKIYKDDITNMNWKLNNDWKIEKKDVGGGQYEYTVQFTATQDIERTDPNKEKFAKYSIKGIVGTEGKISALNMTKIIE